MKKYTLTIGNKEQEIVIIKKKKKNISLQVKPNLEVILSIPTNVSYSYGLEIIKNKFEWINEKIEKYSALNKIEGVYYLGKLYSYGVFKETWIKDLKFDFDRDLEGWYFIQLKNILESYIDKYSKKMSLYPKKINIKTLKSAWGICYSSGTITFNLNLIKAPTEVIEYLVVHELGHLKYPNHSKEYWNYISKFIENPKSYRKWLKDNGYKLNP
ncbi:MAG: M48 family metallopeptidase [Psychrilyobacter sp.]|nr:M48 family metallopeptidase [Psychrilyobacter sp.]